MGLIKDIRTKLHNYFLTKELKTFKQMHESVDFVKAKTIGLLFDGTELSDRETIVKYAQQLKKQGKNTKLLAFIDGDQQNGDFVFPHFTYKNLDWALRPNTQAATDFQKQSFDILINLSPKNSLPLEYISAFSKAKFRVGPLTDKTFCYELMIDTAKNDDLKGFIQQLSFFLNKITNSHETATA